MGATAPERLGEVVRAGFRQAVYDCGTAAALAGEAERARVRAAVHLKVETGTNRLGARVEQARELAAFVRSRSALQLEGIYTHFATVEEEAPNLEPVTQMRFAGALTNHATIVGGMDPSYTSHQLRRFRDVLTGIEGDEPAPLKHCAATAAAILYPQAYFNLVRVGIGLYGLWPSRETQEAAQRRGVALDLRPVLSWKARIVHLNDVPFGEPIGYGCTYVATRPRRIAVLPAGYYEGLDRSLSNRGRVLVRGCLVPIVGRVAMNMCMVDVTDVPHVAVGDEAVLIGRQGERAIAAEDLAALLDTINYEVVTRISPAVPRVWVGDGNAEHTESRR